MDRDDCDLLGAGRPTDHGQEGKTIHHPIGDDSWDLSRDHPGDQPYVQEGFLELLLDPSTPQYDESMSEFFPEPSSPHDQQGPGPEVGGIYRQSTTPKGDPMERGEEPEGKVFSYR